MALEKLDKGKIGLAGEMRVASELLKKGYNASITFGNSKATDIVVFGDKNRFLRVEVKTSKNQRNFVTGYYPKYTDESKASPDVWVMYLPDKQAKSNGYSAELNSPIPAKLNSPTWQHRPLYKRNTLVYSWICEKHETKTRVCPTLSARQAKI